MILYSIDTPKSWDSIFSDDFYVSGWAYSESGEVKITISVDNNIIHEKTANLIRSDLPIAMPEHQNIDKSGYSVQIGIRNLEHKEHVLEIVFSDSKGNTVTEKKKFKVGIQKLRYHKYYVSQKNSEYKDLKRHGKAIDMQFCIEFIDNQSLELTLNSLKEAGYSSGKISVFIDKTNSAFNPGILTKESTYSLGICESIEEAMDHLDPKGWVTLLKSGELIDRMFAQQIKASGIMSHHKAIVYDNDHYQDDGLHSDPFFKPAWSYHLYLSKDYVGGTYTAHVETIKNSLERCGNIKNTTCWRYEVLLKIHESGNSIGSLQRVLCSKPHSELKRPLSEEKQILCISEHLNRIGIKANIRDLGEGNRKISPEINQSAKVSIIIPTTGKIKYVKPCLESIINKTDYKNYEIIFIDNGRGQNQDGIEFIKSKGIRIEEKSEPFNWSTLNNFAAKNSDGELLLFLNDDIEVKDSTWLTELVSQIFWKDVGAVGGMLLYPNGDIQHAGVFLVDHGGGARHWLHFLNPRRKLHLDYQKIVREVSATTGACILIKRDIFELVNGFEEELKVVGNDVDICLKIREKGYHILWTPFCTLIHHESVSRKELEFSDDETRMWQKWRRKFSEGDPFYNNNLNPYNSNCTLKPIEEFKKNNKKRKNIKKGLNIIGYIKAEMGIGEAVRGVIRAVEITSLSYDVINYEIGNPARMGDSDYSHLISMEGSHAINLWHINADLIAEAMANTKGINLMGKYNIGYWAWELPVFPVEWCSAIDLVDEIWVPSEFVAESVRDRTSKPVEVIAHPIEKNTLSLLQREYFNIPLNACTFLTAYDVNSIRQRKNPEAAINSFKKTFKPNNKKVLLVVKLNNATVKEVEYLNQLIDGWSNIRIMTEILDRFEMDSLLNCIDCFVSLHRSEGFGLAIAEAMILGKPVISTNWSGNVDFIATTYPFLVDFELVKLKESYGPYKIGQYWAEPDIEHASELMMSIATNSAMAYKNARREKSRVQKMLSPKNIGKKIQQRIIEIGKSI